MPRLMEKLPGGVQLVQELGDAWHQALGVHVAHATAAAAATAAAPIAVGERLAALNALQQSAKGVNVCFSAKLTNSDFLFFILWTWALQQFWTPGTFGAL